MSIAIWEQLSEFNFENEIDGGEDGSRELVWMDQVYICLFDYM